MQVERIVDLSRRHRDRLLVSDYGEVEVALDEMDFRYRRRLPIVSRLRLGDYQLLDGLDQLDASIDLVEEDALGGRINAGIEDAWRLCDTSVNFHVCLIK